MHANSMRLTVARLTPVRALLPSKAGELFPFEADTPWLGALTAEAFETLGQIDLGSLRLSVTEYSPNVADVEPRFDEDSGRCTGFALHLSYALNPEEGREAVLAALTEVYGEPTPVEGGFTFSKTEPPVAVREADQAFRVEVGVVR